MFTGLIEEMGRIAGVRTAGDGLYLETESSAVMEGLKIGDSVCINGACQTVTEIRPRSFVVFASRVTASVTTLGGFRPGTEVNLERAMLPSSRFGGHIVQGHVDGRATVTALNSDANGLSVKIDLGQELSRYVVPKGSLAVDGISLTVVSLEGAVAELYIIPETVRATSVRAWKKGTEVNAEGDILAKYVEKMLLGLAGAKGSGDADLRKKLLEEGFLD
jgi:riboflavin synthase